MSKIPEPTRQRIIDALSHSFGHIQLKIDGRRVSFEQRLVNRAPITYKIVPFVDGHHRGGWVADWKGKAETPDQDFARRLMRRRTRQLLSGKERTAYKKLRKLQGRPAARPDEYTQVYWDLWHCPKALVRQLEREFQSIEISEAEDATA